MARTVAIMALCCPEVRPGEIEGLDLTVLSLEMAEVNRPSVDAWWGAGLETLDDQSEPLELLREMRRRRFAGATAANLCLRSDVDASTKKRPGRDDNTPRSETASFECFDS